MCVGVSDNLHHPVEWKDPRIRKMHNVRMGTGAVKHSPNPIRDLNEMVLFWVLH